MLEPRCIRSQYGFVLQPPSLPPVLEPAISRGKGPDVLAPDHLLRAGDPVGEGIGSAFARERIVEPLRAAFPMLQIRTDLSLSGHFREGHWSAASGHLFGRFQAPLWSIPPTDRLAFVRFGCFQRWCAGIVEETLLLLDLPALMMQAGVWPLAPSPGPLLMAPPPQRRTEVAAAESLAQVEAMIAGLMRYDGRTLASMGMRDHWTPDFCWYGPAPIGNFQGHEDYERGHQAPFLRAFPDRVGGNHRARIAEADLVASTGWPSIRATHLGDDWLGRAATGTKVEMRVMDFWRAESGRLAENWVMIDLVHLLAQLGVDLFGEMRAAAGSA
jgi:predicted ester cyclase